MSINKAFVKQIIQGLQNYISKLGFKAVINFELEGVYVPGFHDQKIDYQMVNQAFSELNIDGKLIPEYWQNQWEFVSDFNGQSPLKEAENLDKVCHCLPRLLANQGIPETLIKPVIWSGDCCEMAQGSKKIFSQSSRAVHIPNATQLNISVQDNTGINLIAETRLGELLQHSFLKTCLANCLLFLPDHASFERLALRTRYGLEDELNSPCDISGGHQGSIALYREKGKHNQPLGVTPFFFDIEQKPIISEQNWQRTARVEHRLGAASLAYNPYVNIVYALLNIVDSLHVYLTADTAETELFFDQQALPSSLDEGDDSAIALFIKDDWLEISLNTLAEDNQSDSFPIPIDAGSQLKQQVLSQYQIQLVH